MLYLRYPSAGVLSLSPVVPAGISIEPVSEVRGAIASKLPSISLYVRADPLSPRFIIDIMSSPLDRYNIYLHKK